MLPLMSASVFSTKPGFSLLRFAGAAASGSLLGGHRQALLQSGGAPGMSQRANCHMPSPTTTSIPMPAKPATW